LCMAIRFLLAEHMPDGHEQFPRNGDNRLLFANVRGQALKLGLEVADDARPPPRPPRP
jgi:hypothetical protein